MKTNQLLNVCAAAILAGTIATNASSQEKKETAAAHKIVHFGDLKWTPILKGCDLAPVSGDPGMEGAPFVLRIRCADGTKIPPHWHPTDENVTALKGTFLLGAGETYDSGKFAGCFLCALLCPLWFKVCDRFPHPDVTSDLAPRNKKADHRQGGSSKRMSAQKWCKSFVINILTSKPLGLKILQTLFANRAPDAAFQGAGGGG